MNIKLSVILVNYNSGTLTRACLKSLLTNWLPEKTQFIVVDNNSRDESVAFIRADFPEINVIANNKNLGLAAAVNQALRQAKGKYYLLLNPDIIALPAAVKSLFIFMEQHPEIGMAGGQLVSPNGKLQYSCFRFYRLKTVLYRRTWLGKTQAGQRELERFLMKDFDHQKRRAVEWIMGSCMMLRKEAVEQIGGMDERFFLYFEDVDWCRRFWEKGWKVMYVPEAKFSHFYQRSSRQHAWWGLISNWTVREHIRSAARYFWKYRGKPQPEIKLVR